MTLPPALFAIGVVLAAATDWDLVVDGGAEHACAKGRAVCELAIRAVERGFWAPDWRGASLTCEPRPGCFSRCSEAIVGYSAPAECRR